MSGCWVYDVVWRRIETLLTARDAPYRPVSDVGAVVGILARAGQYCSTFGAASSRANCASINRYGLRLNALRVAKPCPLRAHLKRAALPARANSAKTPAAAVAVAAATRQSMDNYRGGRRGGGCHAGGSMMACAGDPARNQASCSCDLQAVWTGPCTRARSGARPQIRYSTLPKRSHSRWLTRSQRNAQRLPGSAALSCTAPSRSDGLSPAAARRQLAQQTLAVMSWGSPVVAEAPRSPAQAPAASSAGAAAGVEPSQ
jgi:hypothetical protein